MSEFIEIKIEKPVRSYSGEMWKTNQSNKKRLVNDFKKRCAYCDDHHRYSGGFNSYHVEHFAPKEKFGHLEFTYDNLLYSCPFCNISKSNKWIGDDCKISVIGEEGFLDPCDDEYYNHLKRNNNGRIVYLSKLGRYIYEELKLYLKRHERIYNLERITTKIKEIQMKVKDMELAGQNTETLRAVYKELCVIFFEYYDALTCDDCD